MIYHLTISLLHIDNLKHKICVYTTHIQGLFTKTNTVCLVDSLKDCNWSLKDVWEEILDSLQRNTHSACK